VVSRRPAAGVVSRGGVGLSSLPQLIENASAIMRIRLLLAFMETS